MGQSLVKNYVHIVFSTKHREHYIQEPFQNDLYSYIASICNNLESYPVKVGGYTDHVHILCMLSKKIALMKLLEEVKAHSSKWMKTRDNTLQNFYWQGGYGAFSVNPSQLETVTEYIANQKEHHQKITFQEEYRKFLKKYKVEFNEHYIWE